MDAHSAAWIRLGWLVVCAVGFAPADAGAQELAARVAGVGTGIVTFSYPMRPDAEICDQGVRIGERQMIWRSRGRANTATGCVSGTASVELRIDNGIVRDVDVLESDEPPSAGSVDLGAVDAREAANYFLSLARGTASATGEEDGVLPAVLANVEDVWRDLLELAQDGSTRDDARSAALFWLGFEAGEAVTVGITAIAADEQEEQDVREAAVFALSQRPGDEGIEPLMELARTAREAETRKTAMFWLAQSEDPRVIAFFEEILLGR